MKITSLRDRNINTNKNLKIIYKSQQRPNKQARSDWVMK